MTTKDIKFHWRELFESRIQIALVDSALDTYKTSFGWLASEQLVEIVEQKRITPLIESARNRDISQVFRLYKTRFESVNSESPRDLRGTFQAIFYGLKHSATPMRSQSEVEPLMRKLIECELMLAFLKEARNVHAHTIQDSRSEAWSQMVIASAIYFFEISGIPRGYESEVRRLSNRSIQRVDKIPDTSLGDGEGTERKSSSEDLASVSRQLDHLTELLESNAEKSKVLERTKELTLPEAEFEKQLQGWREEIAREYQGATWPGPMANLFQRSIISETIKFKPANVEDLLRLPDVAWRYERNKPLMNKQLKSYGDRLARLLERVEWEPDDE